MKPLIGITASRLMNPKGYLTISVMEAYVQAVAQAGAAPVLIPPGLSDETLRETLARLDGILFTGGGDVDPQRFNGDPHPRVDGVDADRDRVEILLAQDAAEKGLPFLGICRGLQVINVALGGTLYTHLADQLPGALKHDYYPDVPRNHLAHPVTVDASSRLAGILGSARVEVNSLHHQGIERPAAGLKVVARAPDGLAEAIELPGHPFGLAVQWHPEWLYEPEVMKRLFRAFVEVCGVKSEK